MQFSHVYGCKPVQDIEQVYPLEGIGVPDRIRKATIDGRMDSQPKSER